LPATIRPNSNSLISALRGDTRWADDTMGALPGVGLKLLEAGAGGAGFLAMGVLQVGIFVA
jgi:hypothetical protein